MRDWGTNPVYVLYIWFLLAYYCIYSTTTFTSLKGSFNWRSFYGFKNDTQYFGIYLKSFIIKFLIFNYLRVKLEHYFHKKFKTRKFIFLIFFFNFIIKWVWWWLSWKWVNFPYGNWNRVGIKIDWREKNSRKKKEHNYSNIALSSKYWLFWCFKQTLEWCKHLLRLMVK